MQKANSLWIGFLLTSLCYNFLRSDKRESRPGAGTIGFGGSNAPVEGGCTRQVRNDVVSGVHCVAADDLSGKGGTVRDLNGISGSARHILPIQSGLERSHSLTIGGSEQD